MNSRLICHVMTKLLPWNLARWLLESRVCVYFSRAQPVVSVSLLDLEEGGQWKVSFCRSISLVAWLFTMRCSCCSQCDPSQGVPALVGLLGRAMHSQGAVWWQGDICQARGASKKSWEALSCQPLLPVPQLLWGSWQNTFRKNPMAQGKQSCCAWVSRHLCSCTTSLPGRKLFLLFHDNLKRGFITRQTVGLECTSLGSCRMLFLCTRAENFACHPW